MPAENLQPRRQTDEQRVMGGRLGEEDVVQTDFRTRAGLDFAAERTCQELTAETDAKKRCFAQDSVADPTSRLEQRFVVRAAAAAQNEDAIEESSVR